MPRPKRAEAERRAFREKVRAAALTLWRREGIDAVTIRRLAKACGCTAPTIYAYFGGRQEIVRSLWRAAGDWLVERALEIDAAGGAPLARVRAIIEAYITFAFEHPDEFRTTFLLVDRSTKEMGIAVADLDILVPFRVLREALAEGMRTGDVPHGDPDAMAKVVWASIHGALALPIHLSTFSLGDPRVLAAQTEAFIMTALAARRGTDRSARARG